MRQLLIRVTSMKTLITATESLDPPLGGAEMSLMELARGVCRPGPTIVSAPDYVPLEPAEEADVEEPWEVISYFSSYHGRRTKSTEIDGLIKKTELFPVKGPLSFLGWRFKNRKSGRPNKFFFGMDLKMRNRRFEKWLSRELQTVMSREGRLIGLTQLKWSAGAAEAFTKSGIPYILFVRDQTHFEYPEIFRKSVEGAEVVCGAGEGLINQIKDLFDVKRVSNVPLPVNFDERFGSKEEIENAIASKVKNVNSRDEGRPRIAIVGITPEKGLKTYEKLIPRVAEDWPEAIFDVYGWKQKFLKKILSMPNVRFHGRVEAEDIFCKCDIQVILTETTGSWGRVVSEAGIFGVPTVTNSVGSQPEAVGEGGLVVKNHRDLEEFSKALKTCYLQREELGRLAESHCKVVDHRRAVAIFREVLESV